MMATKIPWADETWNVIVGSSKVSAGCLNCYAEKRAASPRLQRFAQYREVITDGKWNGKTVFVESALTKPLHWRKPRKIFVNSMGDMFHPSVDFEWICEVLVIAAFCPQHEFKMLTKRSDIMLRFFTQDDLWSNQLPRTLRFYTSKMRVPTPYWLLKKQIPNVHLGVTVENQENVWRILDLVKTPRAKGFISIEPLLGHIDFPKIDAIGRGAKNVLEDISYALIGCESGSGARLCTLDDIRHVMHQCREAGVKMHVKQIPLKGKCNKKIEQWPPEFQVREV